MTDETANPSSLELFFKLTGLAGHFNAEADRAEAQARELRRSADALSEAVNALRAEQKKNRELQRQLDALQQEKAEQAKPESLTFLIDASASMNCTIDGHPPLTSAFDGIEKFLVKFEGTTRMAFNAGVWGDKKVILVTGENYEALKASGLNSGSTFLPVIDYMQAHAEEKHFVILTDGDAYISEAAIKNTMTFLANHSDATIDFVLMTRQLSESMREFVTTLDRHCPERAQILLANDGMSCADTLEKIAQQRLITPQPTAEKAAKRNYTPTKPDFFG